MGQGIRLLVDADRNGLAAHFDRDDFIAVGGGGLIIRVDNKSSTRHESDGNETGPKMEWPAAQHKD